MPVPSPKGAYGAFRLQPLVSIFEDIAQRIKPVRNNVPLTFEAMDINTGFVLYEATLANIQLNLTLPCVNLTVNAVKDRAIIYLDQVCEIMHNRQTFEIREFYGVIALIIGTSMHHESVDGQHDDVSEYLLSGAEAKHFGREPGKD